MCDIGSRRIMPDGAVLFVTDKDKKNYDRDNPGNTKIWADFGGHSGIDLIYPNTRGEGGDEEGFPVPPIMAESINRGEMDEIHRNAHNQYVRVDDNGRLHGPYKRWHENGQLEIETAYKNGNRHGAYKHWYSNGQLFVDTTYKKGKRHGAYKNWYSNGQLSKDLTYKEGEKQ